MKKLHWTYSEFDRTYFLLFLQPLKLYQLQIYITRSKQGIDSDVQGPTKK